MLKGLQLVGICMSMINPTNFYYENKKQANIQYAETVYSQQENWSTQTVTGVGTQYSLKRTARTSYNWAFLNVEATGQAVVDTSDYSTTVSNTIENNYTPTFLTMLQFTPYKNLVDNQITIYQDTRLHSRTYAGTVTLRVITEMFISEDERWLNYMGTTTWGLQNKNLQIRSDIQNANNGFIYTKTDHIEDVQITETVQDKVINQTFIANVNPNKTNYIFFFTYAIALTEGQATGFSLLINNTDIPLAILGRTNMLSITGEYINAEINYEVVDIPSLMFDVLTMPFTFISIAFNLTLFPYTPYQVNISNLFLAIIATLVFILIIRKILGK